MPPASPPRRPPGRPTKCTFEAAVALVQGVAAGHPRAAAARDLGVDPSTVKRWLRRGRADQAAGRATDHAALHALVREAERRHGW